ncbi:MAG TPA: FeoA family protein [Anaerolineales bacterium]|nr:FeoA family protein [Anaerolineales bacterium]
MLLVEAEDDKEYKVIGFKGGKGILHKLLQLGFVPGDQVKVLRRAPLGGPVLVEVNGRMIAIGRGVAEKIHVEE